MYDDLYASPDFASRPAPRPLRLSWLQPIGLLGLSIYNFILRILTLGIHHFWGKTEVRKRIWSAMRVEGEPLEYTGTGGELFTGFLIVFFIILLPVLLATFGVVVMFGPDSNVTKAFQVVLYISFIFLTGIAIYRAQRYRLNRTRWRGIRAGLAGSSMNYAWTYFWTLLAMPLTLGWISPWRQTRLQKIVTDDMRFGNREFHFSGRSGPLYKTYAVFWFLLALIAGLILAATGAALVDEFPNLQAGGGSMHTSPQLAMKIVGLIYGGLFLFGFFYLILSSWYRAAMIRHFASHTNLDNLKFSSSVTGPGLLWIAFSNFVLLFLGAVIATTVLAGFVMLILWLLANSGFGPLGTVGAVSPAHAVQIFAGPGTLIFLLALGMLLPIANARRTGYLVRNLNLSGTIDLAAISAGAEQNIKRGEGLAQAFDIDAL